MNTSWSAVERDLLVKVAAMGLSAREIAKAIRTRSRNAVIGQARRQGVQLQHLPSHIKSVPVVVHKNVRLIDLQSHHCRWPIDGPGWGPTRMSCGAPIVPSESYCPEHCRAAYPSWRE